MGKTSDYDARCGRVVGHLARLSTKAGRCAQVVGSRRRIRTSNERKSLNSGESSHQQPSTLHPPPGRVERSEGRARVGFNPCLPHQSHRRIHLAISRPTITTRRVSKAPSPNRAPTTRFISHSGFSNSTPCPRRQPMLTPTIPPRHARWTFGAISQHSCWSL
ncbi:hypothetical protein RBSH_01984 [Rhodopirellula baltica SH28]|uniref:Uncharacterized protein n=1 Tax=Rhodopirellula baltica SH28 TaxID=993517 RepID=K5EA61_RHOBT|nr:hypothetical protein RBSH_01984 [Rhodopirellula baltica SH28]